MSNDVLLALAGKIKYTENNEYANGTIGKKISDLDNEKYDKSETYSKTEVDNAISTAIIGAIEQEY